MTDDKRRELKPACEACCRQDDKGNWYLEGCYCGNYDDAQAAGAWVGEQNARADERRKAAALVRAKMSGTWPHSTSDLIEEIAAAIEAQEADG